MVEKNALFDFPVTFVVETLQLLGYYFGTKLYPREQSSYDPECVEIPFRPRRRTSGDQFRSLRSRLAFDAASAAAAAASGGNCHCTYLSLDAAPTAAAAASGGQGLRAHFSLDTASAAAASTARRKDSRLAIQLGSADRQAPSASNGRIIVSCHWYLDGKKETRLPHPAFAMGLQEIHC